MNTQHNWKWVKIHWKAIIKTYLMLMGTVSFALFILEEGTQMATFGTWAFKNTRDIEGIKTGCDQIEKINGTLKTLNGLLGWINPFGYIAYERYGQAVDYYVAEHRKAANTPSENQPRNTYGSTKTNSQTYQLGLSDQMPFGKHKGKTIQQILTEAPDYLAWVIGNVERVKFSDDVTKAIAMKSLEQKR